MEISIEDQLKEPFAYPDIEWRIQSAGYKKDEEIWAKCLAYVTNRAIMERLDEVFGIMGWSNGFESGPDGGIICTILAHYEYKTISKTDGAENTQFEPVKGGLSDSMKRAAVQFGIGRYLYNLDVAWADVVAKGMRKGSFKDSEGKTVWFDWNTPKLPDWALPKPLIVEDEECKVLLNKLMKSKKLNKAKALSLIDSLNEDWGLILDILTKMEAKDAD